MQTYGIDSSRRPTFNKNQYVLTSGYGDILRSLSYCIINRIPKLTYQCSTSLDIKTKKEDAETLGERFLYIYDHLMGPVPEIEVTRGSSDRGYFGFYTPMPVWYFKDRWLGDGDYVTVQLLEPELKRSFDAGVTFGREWRIVENIDVTLIPEKIKFLDYSMQIEEVHQLLKHAKFHVGYSGSTTHIAGAVGTPTILISNDPLVGCMVHPGMFNILPQQLSNTIKDVENVVDSCNKYVDRTINKMEL